MNSAIVVLLLSSVGIMGGGPKHMPVSETVSRYPYAFCCEIEQSCQDVQMPVCVASGFWVDVGKNLLSLWYVCLTWGFLVLPLCFIAAFLWWNARVSYLRSRPLY